MCQQVDEVGMRAGVQVICSSYIRRHVWTQAPTSAAATSGLNSAENREPCGVNNEKCKHMRTSCYLCYINMIAYGAIRIHVKKTENSCLCLSKYKKPVCD